MSRETLTEVQWLTQVGRLNADLVPAVLASDSSLAAFAMEYLPPDRHELWKSQLARGCVIPETAATVGRQLAFIHAAFAKSPTAAAEFDTGASFHALRIEPYLLATARVASRSRSHSRRARRANRADEADRRAWRCQPEEHPSGRAWTGVSRRRVRVVRRPGVRSGLLSQSPPVEDAVGAVRGARAAGVVRRAGGCVSARRRLGAGGRPGATGRATASRIVPGAHRRQVARRIPDR